MMENQIDEKMETEIETEIIQRASGTMYCRGLNNHQYHMELYLRYPILELYKESGSARLVIIEGPIEGAYAD